MISHGIYGGYTIAQSNERGGNGRNKTTTIRVLKQDGDAYLLKAQFRYTVQSSISKANAKAKARAWIDAKNNQKEA